MSDLVDLYDDVFSGALTKLKERDFDEEDISAYMKNLKVFSECRPSAPEPEPTPEPTTVLGKMKAGASWAWDNETTRVLMKAGGAFAGIALVTWTTIHRDHVIQREAMSLATQRNS